MRRGLISRRASLPRFSLSITPGRKLWINTSIFDAISRITDCPASSFKSTRIARLPRLQLAKRDEIPPFAAPMYRIGSPTLSGSTLITVAPCSAIIMAANDAVIMVENSKTVTPSNGFIFFLNCFAWMVTVLPFFSGSSKAVIWSPVFNTGL